MRRAGTKRGRMSGGIRRRWRARVLVAVLLLLTGVMLTLYVPFPGERLSSGPVISLRIIDRQGLVLREVLSDAGGRCRWVKLDEISPYVVKATIAAEDRYFFLHPGINVVSMLKALTHNTSQGRIVSGASTLTQQLARNLYRHPRTVPAKLFEAWIALRLEKTLSKEEILAQYLNRVCYGNMTYGIEAAARLYFDKPALDLSLAEAAYLAGLPRSPERQNPYRAGQRAKTAQEALLGRMFRRGMIDRGLYARAMSEPLAVIPASQKFRAPHFCDHVLSLIPPAVRYRKSTVATTLDYRLQEKVEILVKNHLDALAAKNMSNAAVIVLDNDSSDVLCMVGSRDFFDRRHDGQVNGALALRQPGSTLKPFTYGLALEKGMTAAHILEDAEVQYATLGGHYRPQNYDKTFHGPVRMRTALACSYNVPAVALLQELGPDLLFRRLKEAGFLSLDKSPHHYGVGLTLGTGEVSLLELAQAYAALARGGFFQRSRVLAEEDRSGDETGRRIFSAQTAYILTDMLSDADARVPAFGYRSPLTLPFPCAAKTGTSKDFRDNWTLGYSRRYTVGVWVGNFDGKPMHNISGVSGCGPLFRDIMLLLEKDLDGGAFPEPENLVRVDICPESGQRAGPYCQGYLEELFLAGTEPGQSCRVHHGGNDGLSLPEDMRAAGGISFLSPGIRITFPIDGDVFKMDPVLRKMYQTIRFQAALPEGIQPESVTWWLNGRKVTGSQRKADVSWSLRPGAFILELTWEGSEGLSRSLPVRFTVLE